MSFCFEAAWPAGTLRLRLPAHAAQEGTHEGAHDAVAAALALADHEPVLAALEVWLQQPLDPHPAETSDDAAGFVWCDAEGVRLGLPWTVLLASTGAPPPGWLWPELEFEVDVASFDTAPVPPQDPQRAEVLLLPPSFTAPWPVRLHEPALGLAAEAEWAGPGSELRLSAAPVAAAPRPLGRVTLTERCRCTLPQLLGWAPVAAPWRPGPAAALHLADAAAAHPAEHAPIAGRIQPALAGFGLWRSA